MSPVRLQPASKPGRWSRGRALLFGAVLPLLLLAPAAEAGRQQYEPLSASVRAALQRSLSDRRPPVESFASQAAADHWLAAMSPRLAKRLPDPGYRQELLRSIHYEATRAGLDPQLVLGLVEVESGFRKYAVSSAGARGYMQVMPFWIKTIGTPEDNLFHLRTNLRYGCTILRHYLDLENGDLFRALGRYNGSLGRPEYPNLVRQAWQTRWAYAVELSPAPAKTLETPPRSGFQAAEVPQKPAREG